MYEQIGGTHAEVEVQINIGITGSIIIIETVEDSIIINGCGVGVIDGRTSGTGLCEETIDENSSMICLYGNWVVKYDIHPDFINV